LDENDHLFPTEADSMVYLPLLSAAFKLKNHWPQVVFDQYLRIILIATKIPIYRWGEMLKCEESKLQLKKIYVCMDSKSDAIFFVDEMHGFPIRRQPCGHLYGRGKALVTSLVYQLKNN